MGTPITDTHPDAGVVQIALLRQMSEARRFEVVRSLTATVRRLARLAIRERLGERATDEDVAVAFVRLNYGEETASRLREFYDSRGERRTRDRSREGPEEQR